MFASSLHWPLTCFANTLNSVRKTASPEAFPLVKGVTNHVRCFYLDDIYSSNNYIYKDYIYIYIYILLFRKHFNISIPSKHGVSVFCYS